MINLPRSRYAGLTHLINVINEKMTARNVNQIVMQFSYDPISRRSQLLIQDQQVGLAMSQSLANVLGVPDQTSFRSGDHISPQFADIDEGMTALYVYSSIVQNQIVGDAMVPLLRAIPIKTDGGGKLQKRRILTS
jgi:hypothetical protein